MRRCIKDLSSPTGWSLELVPDLSMPTCFEDGVYVDHECFKNHPTCSCRKYYTQLKDLIPCSGFKEGEEVEKWGYTDWSKTAGSVCYLIAVPIKDVTSVQSEDVAVVASHSCTPESPIDFIERRFVTADGVIEWTEQFKGYLQNLITKI